MRNIGDAVAAEDLIITNQFPEGVTAANLAWPLTSGASEENLATEWCAGVRTQTITCTVPGAELAALVDTFPDPDHYLPQLFITVNVAPDAAETAPNTATVSGGGDPTPFTDEDEVIFDATPSPFGVVPGSFLADNFTAAYPFGEPLRQAGAHPFEFRFDFALNQLTGIGKDGTRYRNSNGFLRTVEATLPRGWLGNPEATPKCDPVDFATLGPGGAACPPDTQVGYLSVPVGLGTERFGRSDGFVTFANPNSIVVKYPIYNLEPPRGVLADLAFAAAGIQAHIYPTLDPAQDYAIKAVTPNIAAFALYAVRSAEVTIWGVPGDPAHDRFRAHRDVEDGRTGAPFGNAPIRPFITNPMDCGEDNGGARIRVDSYEQPDSFSPVTEYGDPLNVTGCDDPRIRFEPDISLQPTTRDAGAPTGLDVHFELPQRDDVVTDATDLYAQNGKVKAIPTPPTKKAVVTLPEGMTISPSAAQGLGSCSPAQIGLGTNDPATCPDNSQYGTLTLRTPTLPSDAPMEGFIYIAEQNDNPFNSFLAVYAVIEDPERGLRIKIPGKVELDPVTGQITTTLDDIPQFPVSDLELSLKGGVRAALVNPQTCGTKTITATFYSWHDPDTPVERSDSYEVTQNPDGSPCVTDLADRPFAPQLSAGTLSPSAGTYSPFTFRLTRTDQDQEITKLSADLPPGLTARLAGVAQCSDAALASIPIAPGTGQAEADNPSCPAASEIGRSNVGVGVGVPLTYVPGKVYLAGPYQGAPLSVAVVTPALVGPFDVGNVVVRTALHVDPDDAQVHVQSDAFPTILHGIPTRIRDIRVTLDRPNFTLNPTSCNPMAVTGTATGAGGDLVSTTDDVLAPLTDRFQVGGCGGLGFAPKMTTTLLNGKQGVGRSAHPNLLFNLTGNAGDANLRRVEVLLPSSFQIDQANLGNICSETQLAQNDCAGRQRVGTATARTPLLDQPLSGPVYAVSGSGGLPKLAVILYGPPELPIKLVVRGETSTVGARIKNTFPLVPDAPVSSFALNIDGGPQGYLVNNRNLCTKVKGKGKKKRIVRAPGSTSNITYFGQNGDTLRQKSTVAVNCGKKKNKKKRKR